MKEKSLQQAFSQLKGLLYIPLFFLVVKCGVLELFQSFCPVNRTALVGPFYKGRTFPRPFCKFFDSCCMRLCHDKRLERILIFPNRNCPEILLGEFGLNGIVDETFALFY